MPAYTDYALAAGNNNAAGLVKVGLIIPSSHIAFDEPIALPNFNPGIRKIRMDQHVYITGYKYQVWIFGFITYIQMDYLISTYGGGGYSGDVTIKTRYRSGSYFNANAVIDIPTEGLISTGIGYQSVAIQLRKIIPI